MFGKDKNQKSREKVLYEGQPNIIVYNTSVLWALIVLGFLFTLYGQGVAAIGNMQVYAISSVKQPLTTYFAIAILVLIIVTFLFIAIKLLSWTSVKYTITESRVIVEKGIIFNKQNSMPFNTIQDVSRTQSIIGRILSVGSIELYSAYDGKNLKIEDISSPKKVEDLIFENLRGTHLRTPVDYDNGYSNDFAPAEPGHYRRMEDLDDLTLVNAKEQKKMQREIRRQARRNKYRREHPKYGSQDGYDTKYGQGYNQQYAPDYDSGYYEGNSGYRQNSNRDMNYNPHYGKSHRGSGAIRESYRQNPDKYFADNYEEFHQNNLDARDNYIMKISLMVVQIIQPQDKVHPLALTDLPSHMIMDMAGLERITGPMMITEVLMPTAEAIKIRIRKNLKARGLLRELKASIYLEIQMKAKKTFQTGNLMRR